MKDKIKKIITFIGFTLVVIACVMLAMEIGGEGILSIALPSIFAVCFIFANNATIKNFGYAISAVNLAIGIPLMQIDDTMLLGVGLIIMSVASIFYFIEIVFGFFGYVINRTKGTTDFSAESDSFNEVEKYAQLFADGIISEEEYSSLKAKILAIDNKKKVTSLEDLKRWKKLVDKNLISEEEYASIKNKILK